MSGRLILSLQAGLAGKDASLVVSGLLALLLIAAIGMQKAPPAAPSPAKATPEDTVESNEAPDVEPAIPLAPATVTLPPPPQRAETQPDAPTVEPAPPVEAVESPASVEPLAIETTSLEPEPLVDSPAEATVAATESSESPATKPAEKARPLSAEAHRQGRALLMLVESGEGPSITIDWPTSATGRAALIDHLRRCHGMELALLVGDGSIVRLEDPPGHSGPFDLDRWSGFLRLPSGGLTAAEEESRNRLMVLHGAGQLVRLFPRRVDSGILGGLAQALGENYRRGHDIRLAYEWEQGRIVLGQLRLDGAPHDGRLVLPEVGPCR